MLKKLFISLIILSALTSDASAFTAIILSAGLNPEYLLSQLESSRIQPEAAGNLNVAADEIIKSGSTGCRLVFLLPENVSLKTTHVAYSLFNYEKLQFESQDLTYFSGTSPPFC